MRTMKVRNLWALGLGLAGFVITAGAAAPRAFAQDLCGDGIVGQGEDCDDGNRRGEDGCSPTCRAEQLECDGQMVGDPSAYACGSDEACGEGNRCDLNGCTPSKCGCANNGLLLCTTDCLGQCVPADEPACGNGVVEEGEGCDDGNRKSGDGCSPTCQNEFLRCGDTPVPNPAAAACDSNRECGQGNWCNPAACVPSSCGCSESGRSFCTLDCSGSCEPICSSEDGQEGQDAQDREKRRRERLRRFPRGRRHPAQSQPSPSDRG